MGNGLKSIASGGASSFRDNGMLSPRNVVNSARNDMARMNNTVNGGMSVTGSRKNGWENPNTTARNGLGNRDAGLTIQDIVDNVMKKPVFGIDGYNPKATVKDLLPVNTHVRAKAKRTNFVDDAIKKAGKVP